MAIVWAEYGRPILVVHGGRRVNRINLALRRKRSAADLPTVVARTAAAAPPARKPPPEARPKGLASSPRKVLPQGAVQKSL